MKFEEWEPYYRAILEDFGWTSEGDEQAALLISSMLPDPSFTLKKLKALVEGKDVLVCGKAPTLERDLKGLDVSRYTVIAADGATSVLLKNGIVPHVIVSDLDGRHEDLLEANGKGAIILAHAHSDNVESVKSMVPRLKDVIGTTQAKPLHNVFNFGGFSDGDRCIFMVKDLGAASITIVGFDLDDTDVTPKKLKKLKWARILLRALNVEL